jgi:drug/metabolite transporter (DMT)-like permease
MVTNLSRRIKLDATRTGIFMICLVSFIWALMEIVTQMAAVDTSLYQVVWVRYAAHLAFMLLVFAPRHGLRILSTRRLGLQIVRALMMLVMPVSFIIAAPYMNVGNILTIFWLSPLMIIALSMLLLKERVAWYIWAIALVGFACIAAITHPNLALNPLGVMLALAMGLSFSLYLVMTRMLREESTVTNLFYTAAGVLLPLSLRLPAIWKPLTLQGGLLMALVGLLGFALLWVLDKTFEIVEPAVVAPFLYSQMFWMIVLKLIARIF